VRKFSLKWHVLLMVLLCTVVLFQLNQMREFRQGEYQYLHGLFQREIRLDAESELNMLMIQNHYINHYDTLTESLQKLQKGRRDIAHALVNIPMFVNSLRSLKDAVAIQTQAIEDFKSDIGIYMNSERYLLPLTQQMMQEHPNQAKQLEAILLHAYQYLLETGDAGLRQNIKQAQQSLSDLTALNKHVNILLEYSQRIRDDIQTAATCGTPENIHKLSQQFDAKYAHDVQVQRHNSYALMVLVLVMLVYLSFLVWHVVRLLKEQTKDHLELTSVKAQLEDKVHDLLKVEERFQHLFDVIPDAVVVHKKGICVFANPAALVMYGYDDAKDMVGKNVLEHIYEDDRATVVQRMCQLQEEGKTDLLLEKHLRHDGSMFFAEVQGVSFEEQGERVWVVLVRDVTQRLQAEKDQHALQSAMEHAQRLESLGVLAGGIAHDFNNLLAAIMGNIELLKRNVPMADIHGEKYTTRIMNASQRAADLCQQMLAYSGQGKFVVQPTQLSNLIQEMVDILHVSMNKAVRIDYQLDTQLPLVQADQSQMQQVILNLMINANEAMTSGVILCTTGVRDMDESTLQSMMCENDVAAGEFVFIEVKDQGHGMDRQTLKKIFDPFFTTKFTGRGLGMSAVLGIVRGHHGALDVHSEVGKGTRFCLYFPVDAEARMATTAGLEKAGANCACDVHATVLVVDDEEVVREVAGAMLEDIGAKVLYAEDGLQALDTYKQHAKDIDVILLDMTMPKMDGKACFDALMALNAKVQVVIASGYHQSEIRAKFSDVSLAGVVQKPYTYEEFEQVMLPLLPKAC